MRREAIPGVDLDEGQRVRRVGRHDASMHSGFRLVFGSLCRRPAAWIVAVAIGAVLAACGGDDDPEAVRVTIVPASSRVALGSTLRLDVKAYDQSGALMPGTDISWTSSNEAVATVSVSGLVTAVGEGSANISAATHGVTVKATVDVAQAALINVFNPGHVLAPGGAEQLPVQVLDASNEVLVADLAWSTDDPGIAGVDASGRVTGRSTGVTTVRIAAGGVSRGVAVAVQEPVRSQIAFASKREPPFGVPLPRPSGGVYLMNADGSGVHLQVADAKTYCVDPGGSTCPLPVVQPAVAPDGLRMAVVRFMHWEAEFTDTEIWICATAQPLCEQVDYPGAIRPPGPNVTVHGVSQPAWSPDGRKLVFVSATGTLWLWDLATATWVDLGTGGNPAWSPDGSRIAYVADGGIWLTNPDGSSRVRLSEAGASDSHPTWSPDGHRIAFARVVPGAAGGDSDIFVMNGDGSGVTDLTNHPANDRSPAWSGDGARIAFVSDRDGNDEIHLMDPDGGRVVNLTVDPAPDTDPSWSP